MPIELTLLGWAAILGLVHVVMASDARTRQYGLRWNMGARDAEMPPLNPVAGRLARAQANFFETFPLFAALLLGAVVGGRLGWKTEVGASLYLGARTIYLLVYAAGIPRWRTAIFGVSLLGLALVAKALLFG